MSNFWKNYPFCTKIIYMINSKDQYVRCYSAPSLVFCTARVNIKSWCAIPCTYLFSHPFYLMDLSILPIPPVSFKHKYKRVENNSALFCRAVTYRLRSPCILRGANYVFCPRPVQEWLLQWCYNVAMRVGKLHLGKCQMSAPLPKLHRLSQKAMPRYRSRRNTTQYGLEQGLSSLINICINIDCHQNYSDQISSTKDESLWKRCVT